MCVYAYTASAASAYTLFRINVNNNNDDRIKKRTI